MSAHIIKNSKPIALWLFTCAALVLMMIAIGGYTRLQGAGLSIVEWKPLNGVIFPTSENSWNEEFGNYQKFPEYREKNFAISLSEFKKIYFIEYFHRLVGRFIGVFFFIPFIYFIYTKQLNARSAGVLLGVFSLGAIQGGIGWYMVRSGLDKNPEVSQYRLVLHLMMALFIYGLLVWNGLKFFMYDANTISQIKHRKHEVMFKNEKWYKVMKESDGNIMCRLCILSGMVLLQIVLGGLVAGMKGGLVYNTFPLMDGEIIPQGIFILSPWYMNFFENIILIQFLHRLTAFAILVYTLYIVLKIYASTKKYLYKYVCCLLFVVGFQFILGIITLIKLVPVNFALMHQVTAIILFTNLLLIAYKLTYAPDLSIINSDKNI